MNQRRLHEEVFNKGREDQAVDQPKNIFGDIEAERLMICIEEQNEAPEATPSEEELHEFFEVIQNDYIRMFTEVTSHYNV